MSDEESKIPAECRHPESYSRDEGVVNIRLTKAQKMRTAGLRGMMVLSTRTAKRKREREERREARKEAKRNARKK